MATLDGRIRILEILVERLKAQIENLTGNKDFARKKPYSKVGSERRLNNMHMEFDGNEGLWKPYAIYKDDEEE